MKHAFLISAHKNYEQLEILIDQLSFGDIYIHVDLKNEPLYLQLQELAKAKDNLIVLKNRIKVNWSGLSIVKAQNRLLKAACDNGSYDYIHNMSGQDLLLMTHDRFDQWFKQNPKSEHIECKPAEFMSWRLRVYSLFRENPKNRTVLLRGIDILLRLVQLPFVRRRAFRNQQIWLGSNWFSITQPAAEYILKVTREESLEMVYEKTACPDEHYYQMILKNSPFSGNINQNTGRYIKWEGGNSPKTLTMADYQDLMNSGCIIARKFDLNTDPKIISEITRTYDTVS